MATRPRLTSPDREPERGPQPPATGSHGVVRGHVTAAVGLLHGRPGRHQQAIRHHRPTDAELAQIIDDITIPATQHASHPASRERLSTAQPPRYPRATGLVLVLCTQRSLPNGQ